MVDSVEAAKYIMLKAKERGIEINMTKLQKFLYIFDGTLLALGESLIDEHPRVWPYGPVYPKVYKWHEKNKKAIITVTDINKTDFEKLDSEKDIVSSMFDNFGEWTSGKLSTWSHEPLSPWAATLNKSGGKMGGVINKKDMVNYFKSIIKVGADEK